MSQSFTISRDNIIAINGIAPSVGNGGVGTGVLRVTLANDSTGVIATVGALTAITNALPAGNNNIGDVDIASSVLPTGASTLAEQQTQTTALGTLLTSANFAAAFGTAGTADTQVMSVQGIAAMTPLLVDGSGTTQPVSGTVTVISGTAANLKAEITIAAAQTLATVTTVGTVSSVTAIANALPAGNNIIGQVKITDGTDVADVIDSGTFAGIGAYILDGSGNPITSFGGGTQYATNVAYADGNIGTLALTIRDDVLSTLTEADGDYSGLRVTSTGRLWVSAAVESSALPTGAATLAEQQTQTASLSVLDDWDESDRAKVNIIVGQAGIAAGTGTDGATVPRVTLATNVPLPAGTNGIGKLTANSGVTIGAVEIAAAQTLATVTTVGTVTAVTAITNALPAGTNAIGKLAANSGVDIGDVDVTSLPRSQQGPGQPGTAVDSYTHAAINLAAGNDQVLVASAANKQIWVYGISFVLNVAGTVSFQDEDNTAISGIMPFAANSGMSVPPSGNFSMPIWKLATDKDLEVDVTVAELDGWLDYAIISV